MEKKSLPEVQSVADVACRRAQEWALSVGKFQTTAFRGKFTVSHKENDCDLVTNIDKESERTLIEHIRNFFPDHKILGEEGGETGNLQSDYCWIIDPLDGTTNFSQGLPIWAISIGLTYCHQTIMGVVYAPYLKELYWAQFGMGAFLGASSSSGPTRLHVGTKKTLKEAVISTGFPYDKDVHPENNAREISLLIPKVRGIRRMGAAAYDLCLVAAGNLDAHYEQRLFPWDVCAGNLMVSEAGGEVVSYRNDRGISIAAGNKEIIDQLLPIITPR